MSAYEAILGHRRPIALLERARSSARVAHAYLFFGPDGVGKEKVAFAFAQALNCSSAGEGGCGRCESCQKIGKGTHPDVRLVASEEELAERGRWESDKPKNPSEQIRNQELQSLADLFRHRPYLGRWKVVVVVDADKLNAHAQNRFLKTLEEPTDDSVIILVTSRPEALLPTVRSRCQALAFGPLPRTSVARYLAEHSDLSAERIAVVAAMSQGSLGRAVLLAQEEGILAQRDRLIAAVAKIPAGDLGEVLEAAVEHGKDRSSLQDTLDLLEIWFRDLLMACLNVAPNLWINQDRIDQVQNQASSYSRHRLLHFIERIRRVRGDLVFNVNPQMATESLLLGLRSH